MPYSSTENKRRALRAHRALLAYDGQDDRVGEGEEETAEALSDLLGDLRHYCDGEGLSFAELDRRGYRHYGAEAWEAFAEERAEPLAGSAAEPLTPEQRAGLRGEVPAHVAKLREVAGGLAAQGWEVRYEATEPSKVWLTTPDGRSLSLTAEDLA